MTIRCLLGSTRTQSHLGVPGVDWHPGSGKLHAPEALNVEEVLDPPASSDAVDAVVPGGGWGGDVPEVSLEPAGERDEEASEVENFHEFARNHPFRKLFGDELVHCLGVRNAALEDACVWM